MQNRSPRVNLATDASRTIEPDPEALITSRAACDLAGGISAMTLWRWHKAGLIPEPLTIRGRNYWRRAVFLAALEAAASTKDREGT
jgi:hypothetical protein